jgi:hypothetical protein
MGKDVYRLRERRARNLSEQHMNGFMRPGEFAPWGIRDTPCDLDICGMKAAKGEH